MKFSSAFFAFAALSFAAAAPAATINVPADQSTIQAAINAASNGDTVLVAPGIYYELIDFKGKAITVKSSGGAAVTILDGNNSGPIVTFKTNEGNGSVLQGFTLTHGFANGPGSAVYALVASPTIRDDIFADNVEFSGYWGGAIGGNNASPIILRDYFTGNTCGTQLYDSVVGFVNNSSPVIADDVFANNPCPAFMQNLWTGLTTEIYNNTFVGNRYALILYLYSDVTGMIFSNNLIAFNQYGLDTPNYSGSTLSDWTYNLVYGDTTADYQGVTNQTGANGNISSDPKLKDWTNGDIRLLYGSPAIDVGHGAVTQASSTDFYGSSRVFAGIPKGSAVVDIGAAEYHPPLISAVGGTIRVPTGKTTSGVLGESGADPGEPLAFTVLTAAAHGTVTITGAAAGTGAFQYVPAQGYSGADSFTFDLTDPYGVVSNTATEQVLNDPVPTANDGSLHTTPDVTAIGTLSATVAYLGQTLTFSIVSTPLHGMVSLDAGTGQVHYVPATAYVGTDSFTFEVTDAYGAVSNIATESVTVTDVPAKASNGSITVYLQTHKSASGSLQATPAYLGQVLHFSLVGQPGHGTVTLTNAQTGAYTYTVNKGFHGTDSFTFQAIDQYGITSNTATVTVKTW